MSFKDDVEDIDFRDIFREEPVKELPIGHFRLDEQSLDTEFTEPTPEGD